MTEPAHLIICPLAGDVEWEACARLTAAPEPGITLGRRYATSLELLGFIILYLSRGPWGDFRPSPD